MAITLDQVLAAPPDEDELYKHMVKIGAVIPPPPPTPAPGATVPPIQPASAGPKVPDLSTPIQSVPLEDSHPNLPTTRAPKPEPINPGNVPEGVSATPPMNPADHVLPHMGFRDRQNLPTESPGAQPLSSGWYRNQFERLRDQNANHWGTAENHNNLGGKIGHVLAKIGNIAGDIVAPGTTALIPGTELNRRGQGAELQRAESAKAQQEAVAEGIRQRPEIAEITGAMKQQIADSQEAAAQAREEARDRTMVTVGGGHDTARTGAADTAAEARVTTNAATNASKEKIAQMGGGKGSDFDKYYHAQLAEGMPDTAGNRLRAHQAWDAAARDASGGTFIPFYDPDGNVTGAWNPGKHSVQRLPPELAGSTTAGGASIQNKNETRLDKQKKDYTNIIDRASKADLAAQEPTGPGDYQILMSFVEATKPSSGFRFTEAEKKMITDAVSLAGKVNADYDHYVQGTFFSPEQRQQLLDIIHNAATQASGHLKEINEGRVHPSSGNDQMGGVPTGKTAVYDEGGNLHYIPSQNLSKFLRDPKYLKWGTQNPKGANGNGGGNTH